MEDLARVVIIGGGITGCSIAYHLTTLGWKDIVLLEKGELTSGSTFHSAGLVTQFRTSESLMQLQNYSIRLYDQLASEIGDALNWRKVGSLRLASSEDQLKNLKLQLSRARALGLNVDIISPTEAKGIFPPMTEDSLYGAVYIPDDGYLEPNSITMELARRAKRNGAKLYTNVRATGIELSSKGAINKVHTERGSLRTEIVVNAAGQWAPRIGEMVGVSIPMTPITHQFILTKPIPDHELSRNTPVVRDPDNLIYIREEVGGFLIGGFEAAPKAWRIEGVPWSFTQQLLAPNWDSFEVFMEDAIRRVPVLEQSEIIKLINGPEAVTPDGRYCLGPIPGRPGFFIAAGMSLNGIAGAGGVGKIISEWIVEGAPSVDTHEFDVRRFGEHYTDRKFCAARSRETYRYYYYLRYPNDEYECGRPMCTSPLYNHLKQFGAVFGEKNGWERVNYFEPGKSWRQAGADQRSWGWGRPPYFEQVCEEHRAARESVALFDMSSFNKIEVSGSGALKLLQRVADNNIDVPVGSVVYTQFLNKRGGIEGDVTITRRSEDQYLVVTGTAFGGKDLGWLIMHAPQDVSVMLKDVTGKWACLGLWGPNARHVLQKVAREDVSNNAFPYMNSRLFPVGNVSVLALRMSYVGELGWELYVEPQSVVAVWDLLLEAGKDMGIHPAGYKSLDSLRLEKGYRYWGADMTSAENPYEAGLGFCVKLSKGDFIGREALMTFKERGLRRRLCPVTLSGEACVIYGGEAVYFNRHAIGRIRSGGYGYTIGKNIGYTYLPIELAEPGTQVTVDTFGERIPAVVSQDPLFDPQGIRIRQ